MIDLLANSLQPPKRLNYEILYNKIYIIQDEILQPNYN